MNLFFQQLAHTIELFQRVVGSETSFDLVVDFQKVPSFDSEALDFHVDQPDVDPSWSWDRF